MPRAAEVLRTCDKPQSLWTQYVVVTGVFREVKPEEGKVWLGAPLPPPRDSADTPQDCGVATSATAIAGVPSIGVEKASRPV